LGSLVPTSDDAVALLTVAGDRCFLAFCLASYCREGRARPRRPPRFPACLPSYGSARPSLLYRFGCWAVMCRPFHPDRQSSMLTLLQLVLSGTLHHWLHPISVGRGVVAERSSLANDPSHPDLPRSCCMVSRSRGQYTRRIGGFAQPSRTCHVPVVCILHRPWSLVFYHLKWVQGGIDTPNAVLHKCKAMGIGLSGIHSKSFAA
jgi:hypothetical protein